MDPAIPLDPSSQCMYATRRFGRYLQSEMNSSTKLLNSALPPGSSHIPNISEPLLHNSWSTSVWS